MIDLHTHLLPAIDDGADTFEESVAILQELAAHGITELFLTPHYIPATIYDSPRADNLKLLAELKKALKEETDLNLKLHLGNEIYLTPQISQLLKRKVLSPLGDSRHLLVELPISGLFDSYENIFANLIAEGYQIVLAHPERYLSVQKDFKLLKRLDSLGILFQANLCSIIGQYGRRAQKTVKKMAKKDLIFCFGTDTHHARDFSEIDLALAKLTKLYGKAKLDTLLVDNPLKIITTTHSSPQS
ncbi:hypothetical protein IJF89_00635 [Candidatus Saccharibacteria bacterium]|nr:hypothetical protein [Candidatus Saccharibacteria bacterium]